MAVLELKLGIAEIETLIANGLPMAQQSKFCIEELKPGYVRTRLTYADWMLRPGNSLAGPVLMLAADGAMYALVLAHVGAELMAVTADMNMRFLSRPGPVDLIAEARLLKLGRRLAVMEVTLSSAGSTLPVAHITGSYVLPATSEVEHRQ